MNEFCNHFNYNITIKKRFVSRHKSQIQSPLKERHEICQAYIPFRNIYCSIGQCFVNIPIVRQHIALIKITHINLGSSDGDLS